MIINIKLAILDKKGKMTKTKLDKMLARDRRIVVLMSMMTRSFTILAYSRK